MISESNKVYFGMFGHFLHRIPVLKCQRGCSRRSTRNCLNMPW